MKIGIGSDHNAFEMKTQLKEHIETLGIEVIDFGCFSPEEVDYPSIAFEVANGINDGKIERGILVCGTGIGMAMAANKVPGVRAAQCHDTYSAERAQLSNNAQIITMGSKVIGIEVAKKVVSEYLSVKFEGGNSARKIDQIMQKESEVAK
ncbi:ribose 5-phosphate isomerase B [Enterococcus sp. 7E2_DIV0204]|uniref:Ribose 5-phosphate isomerase B n=1 Tax=Candidatus Enterococcus lemimoniae TaxID=1834167 RepID=A0ABZ2T583_9ENTE|nr:MULTISPECIES: ribose 5-phosphate isomerase B [unclassified Enterococcus]OTN89380.1 ribose 5-phosphate isomerase B [Enterococcus sp. 7E2_DIV0204]OTO68227.1 ribose 5-phosphate isomerase B [Enterococcus sp. 12C11_DIV0727]OTP51834.1 ribose 5-phosphate isomerase B [Enterococcus sp. 7D2_DIV0200]